MADSLRANSCAEMQTSFSVGCSFAISTVSTTTFNICQDYFIVQDKCPCLGHLTDTVPRINFIPNNPLKISPTEREEKSTFVEHKISTLSQTKEQSIVVFASNDKIHGMIEIRLRQISKISGKEKQWKISLPPWKVSHWYQKIPVICK